MPASGDLVDHGYHVDRGPLGGRRVAGEVEQLIDGRLEAIDGTQRDLEGTGRVGLRMRELGLEREAKSGQRGAELVRRVGRERLLTFDEAADANRCRRERVTDLVELTHPRARRPDSEVAVADPSRVRSQSVERSGETPDENRRTGRDHADHGDRRRAEPRPRRPYARAAGIEGFTHAHERDQLSLIEHGCDHNSVAVQGVHGGLGVGLGNRARLDARRSGSDQSRPVSSVDTDQLVRLACRKCARSSVPRGRHGRPRGRRAA